MIAPMKALVFDSHAVLRWLQKEKGWQKVKTYLTACRDEGLKGLMNRLNLGEVYYLTIRRVGLEEARAIQENLHRLPIQFLLPDQELIREAGEIKARHPISYADCFVAATALRFKASILTGDPEFKKIENLVSIEWI